MGDILLVVSITIQSTDRVASHGRLTIRPINSHRDVNRPIWRRCMDDEYTRDDLGVKFTLNNRRLDNTHALISNFPLSEWNEHCTEFYTRNINIFESEERNRE